jgi:hypothetical protein
MKIARLTGSLLERREAITSKPASRKSRFGKEGRRADTHSLNDVEHAGGMKERMDYPAKQP